MKRKGQKWSLTRGALLLFAQEIIQFHPNCRVRFTRYEGTTQGVGSQLNIIKDVNFDLPILKLIPATTRFMASQLKELTRLNPSTGRFETTAEYPEFAWTEALINAIAHREYALEGAFIQISMFDDRLEISSPGRLPNIVTIDNIQYTRYSCNPHLARVLIDFGWVRELNEGVKRIYAEMRESNLAEPKYSEPDSRYVLITMTNKMTRPTESINTQHSTIEQQIIACIREHKELKIRAIIQKTGKSRNTVNKYLRKLMAEGVICAIGAETSPERYYQLAYNKKIT